jgi:hypothetical protein
MLTILAAVIVGAYLGAGIVLAWWAYCDRKDNRRNGK